MICATLIVTMAKYVALLRGIAPMNPNMRNEKVRSVFEELGFLNVRSVIASGNILFESSVNDVSQLEGMIEKALPEKLNFTSTTIIRSLEDLEMLIAADPFKGKVHAKETSLNVTFLKHPLVKDLDPPEGNGYSAAVVSPQEICAVIDTTLVKTPDYMAKAERIYSKEITTRTWNTVLRIRDKLKA